MAKNILKDPPDIHHEDCMPRKKKKHSLEAELTYSTLEVNKKGEQNKSPQNTMCAIQQIKEGKYGNCKGNGRQDMWWLQSR